MNKIVRYTAPVILSAVLASCGDVPASSGPPGKGDWQTANARAKKPDVTVHSGHLVVSRDAMPVSVIRTALPVIEEWRFAQQGKSIVTKSRASHGPATLELWDLETGKRKDKIQAYAVKNGKPQWAAPFAE